MQELLNIKQTNDVQDYYDRFQANMHKVLVHNNNLDDVFFVSKFLQEQLMSRYLWLLCRHLLWRLNQSHSSDAMVESLTRLKVGSNPILNLALWVKLPTRLRKSNQSGMTSWLPFEHNDEHRAYV
jgi:hypothetical protein